MSLTAEIKKRRMAALKAKNTLEKEILGVALGEIQTAAAREGKDDLEDAEVQAILKKLVKSNREALGATEDAGKKAELSQEIEVIESLLPKALGVDEIVAALSEVADQIKAAANPGPAMGVAMKVLKAAGKSVEAKDVSAAIQRIRG